MSELTERLSAYASKPSSRRSVDEGDDLMREGADRIEELLAALKALIPTNINLDHCPLPDTATLPCDVPIGELRAAAAAVAKAEATLSEDGKIHQGAKT